MQLRRRLLLVGEREAEIQKCLKWVLSGGSAYVCGTGGSFAAAAFAAQVLESYGGYVAHAIRPFDYVRLGRRADITVVLTYSGRTQDCADAITHAKANGTGTIVLITSLDDPPLRRALRPKDIAVSYGRGDRGERGFVSIVGTVAPCLLLAASVSRSSSIATLVQGLGKSAKAMSAFALLAAKGVRADTVLPVLGGGWAWPAMIDLESKFVEAGLGYVQLHEVKDFSHGRFMSLFNDGTERQPVVFLSSYPIHPYERELLHALKHRGRPVLHLRSSMKGVLGGLQLLFEVQLLAHAFANAFQKDLSRPVKIPSRGLALYKWRGGLASED